VLQLLWPSFFVFTCLPKLSLLLLGRDLDHSGLVDDPGRPVTLLHDANDPGLVALLLLDVLAEGGGLLPGQTDEKSAAGLGAVALQELEHVAAGLGHGGHLGDDRKVVDHEANLVLLVTSEVLGVAQQTEA
jgi:hypothetical protein